MNKYSLKWPDEFEKYAWELESKGWFAGLEILVDDKVLRPIFYDPARLSQDIVDEMSGAGHFFEPFLVVIPKVTQESIERAVAILFKKGQL